MLVHGWESNSARWEKFINRFSEVPLNIVALDAPAHGKSGSHKFSALTYAEYINVAALHYKPDYIVGHSVGGMAMAIYQSKYQNPDLLKMVLLGSPSSFRNVITRYEQLMNYNKRVSKALSSYIESEFDIAIDTFSTAKKLAGIKTPTLIIHDKDDTVIPFKDAESISKATPNGRLVSTHGLGHSLNSKNVTQAVIEFIST